MKLELYDKILLDFLDNTTLRPGEGWILRQSSLNRNLRLHVTTTQEVYRIYQKQIPIYKTAREAITKYLEDLEEMDD